MVEPNEFGTKTPRRWQPISSTTLTFVELTFEGAHYLPAHPHCGCIHGHTWFIRDLEITTGEEWVDFGEIKAAIKEFDHRFIVPEGDGKKWNDERSLNSLFFEQLGISIGNILEMDQGSPTVENLSRMIKRRLLNIVGVIDVEFKLYEGPNQGGIAP